MKKLPILFSLILVVLISCSKKEGFITSPDAQISVSVDTVFFDTVFTSSGSITQTLKIFNNNDRKLKLSEVELMGGASSPFRINVGGIEGPLVNDTDIEANDSTYVFITVSIDPTSDKNPFVVRDSLRVSYNGNNTFVQLNAYGQNARYLKGEVISTSTTWDATLPYVILDGILVAEGVTLTIEKGTRIHMHADAPFLVDGTLVTNGTKTDSVTFQGDRLDNDYKDLPASWPGIYFRNSSTSNSLRYTIIKNGYQGVIAGQANGSFPKLSLNECTIDNIYDAALTGINSSIRALNCLITNSGLNVLLVNGGNYEISHCTVASYSNVFIPHKRPVLVISNWDSTNQVNTYDLQATLTNNIFWGDQGNVENEVVVFRRGPNPFSVTLENCLYKAATPPNHVNSVNNLVNQPPLFDTIDENGKFYDFRISKGRSPAIDKGKPLGVPTDLDGLPRGIPPDIGCYEKQ
jgi:hypothetical protein